DHPTAIRWTMEKFRPQPHHIHGLECRSRKLPEKRTQNSRVRARLGRWASDRAPKPIIIAVEVKVQELRGAFEMMLKVVELYGPTAPGHPRPFGKINFVE